MPASALEPLGIGGPFAQGREAPPPSAEPPPSGPAPAGGGISGSHGVGGTSAASSNPLPRVAHVATISAQAPALVAQAAAAVPPAAPNPRLARSRPVSAAATAGGPAGAARRPQTAVRASEPEGGKEKALYRQLDRFDKLMKNVVDVARKGLYSSSSVRASAGGALADLEPLPEAGVVRADIVCFIKRTDNPRAPAHFYASGPSIPGVGGPAALRVHLEDHLSGKWDRTSTGVLDDVLKEAADIAGGPSPFQCAAISAMFAKKMQQRQVRADAISVLLNSFVVRRPASYPPLSDIDLQRLPPLSVFVCFSLSGHHHEGHGSRTATALVCGQCPTAPGNQCKIGRGRGWR